MLFPLSVQRIMTRGQCDLVWVGAAFLLLREATPPGSQQALVSVSIWISSAKAPQQASQAQPRVDGNTEKDEQIVPMILLPRVVYFKAPVDAGQGP